MIDIILRQPGAPDAGAALGNGSYLIGAGKECHIPIARPDISRRHAQLIVNDRSVTVMDMGSSNGTALGDGTPLFPNRPYHLEGKTNVLRLGRSVELVINLREEARKAAVNDDFSVDKGEIPLLELSGIPRSDERRVGKEG